MMSATGMVPSDAKRGLSRLTRRQAKWLLIAVVLIPAHWHVGTHRSSDTGGGSCYAAAEGWSPWPIALHVDRRRGDGPTFSYTATSSCSARPGGA
jgi:hypothetical protein